MWIPIVLAGTALAVAGALGAAGFGLPQSAGGGPGVLAAHA